MIVFLQRIGLSKLQEVNFIYVQYTVLRIINILFHIEFVMCFFESIPQQLKLFKKELKNWLKVFDNYVICDKSHDNVKIIFNCTVVP